MITDGLNGSHFSVDKSTQRLLVSRTGVGQANHFFQPFSWCLRYISSSVHCFDCSNWLATGMMFDDIVLNKCFNSWLVSENTDGSCTFVGVYCMRCFLSQWHPSTAAQCCETSPAQNDVQPGALLGPDFVEVLVCCPTLIRQP